MLAILGHGGGGVGGCLLRTPLIRVHEFRVEADEAESRSRTPVLYNWCSTNLLMEAEGFKSQS